MQIGAFLTPLRRDLLDWFKAHAPTLGELYEGARALLFSPPLPGWTRFVAHAVREIANALPRVVAGLNSQQVQYPSLLDDIVSGPWTKSGLPLDGAMPISRPTEGATPEPDITISRELFVSIAELVKEHLAGRKRPPEAAGKLYDSLVPQDQLSSDARVLFVTRWPRLIRWFVGCAHAAEKSDSNFERDEFLRQFDLFEEMLAALLRPFFATVEELDAIIQDANS